MWAGQLGVSQGGEIVDPMTPDEVIRQLSERQHGVLHRRQLIHAGVPSAVLRRRIAGDALLPLSSVVLRMAGTPRTRASVDMAAVLDSGLQSSLSHLSAAARWGLPAGDVPRPHVTAPRTHRRQVELAIVHEPRSLEPTHTTAVDGIPITTPARTLFDIANLRGVHPDRIERFTDAALSRGLTTVARLRTVLDELPTRGRRGRALMRRLIEERETGTNPTESNLEFRFAALAKQAGFRELDRQVDLGDGDDWIGRVDFVDRAARMVVEIDGERFHSSHTDLGRDQRRQRRLEQAGWTVVRFSDVDVWHRGAWVVEQLRAVRRVRRPDQLAG